MHFRVFFFFSAKNDDTAYPSYIGLVTQLGVQYIDLYLIHDPQLAIPDISTAWKKMEDLKNDGLVKYVSYFSSRALLTLHLSQWRSIGISNFNVKDIEILLASAKIKPAVNQVRSASPNSIDI